MVVVVAKTSTLVDETKMPRKEDANKTKVSFFLTIIKTKIKQT
jgi:hypothetical protein